MAEQPQSLVIPFEGYSPGPPTLGQGAQVVENLIPAWGAMRSVPEPSGTEVALELDYDGAPEDYETGVQTFANGAFLALRKETGSRFVYEDLAELDASQVAFTEIDNDIVRPVVATANRIYLDGTWKTSGSGSLSLLPYSTDWSFCQFGPKIIAANGGAPLMVYNQDDPPASGNFEDLIPADRANKPTAKYATVFGSHILLGNLYMPEAGYAGGAFEQGPYPETVWYSASEDETTYTTSFIDPDTNSDFAHLYDTQGEITGCVGFPDAALILKRYGSHLIRLTGGPGLVSYHTVDKGIGCIQPRTVIAVDTNVFFMAQDGFRVSQDLSKSQQIMPPTLQREMFDLRFPGNYSLDLSTDRCLGTAYDASVGVIIWLFSRASQGDVIGLAHSITDKSWSVLKSEELSRYFVITSLPSPTHLSGIYLASADSEFDLAYRPWLNGSLTDTITTLPAKYRTKTFALITDGANAPVAAGAAGILRVRPIFRTYKDTSALPVRPKISITAARDANMLVDNRTIDMDPAQGHQLDSQGWYTVPNGKFTGNHFEIEANFPPVKGHSLYEVIGMQVEFIGAGK